MGIAEREAEKRSIKKNSGIAGDMISMPKGETLDNIITKKEKPPRKDVTFNGRTTEALYKKVKAKCKKVGISFNECMNQFFEKWVESEKD